LGSTRSIVKSDHAVIAAESQARSGLPGWERTSGTVLVSPAMGARFSQYVAFMEPGGQCGPPRPWVERFAYVLEGEVHAAAADAKRTMKAGDYLYIPPEQPHSLKALGSCTLLVFEHNYHPLNEIAPPEAAFGRSRDAKAKPYLNDSDVQRQPLLTSNSAFDIAINIFNFRPGSGFAQVSVNSSDGAWMMLEGQGVIRLGDTWRTIKAGDAVWIKAHCPHWFVAYGKKPTRYIACSDINREAVKH
jgi:(S)-ureidoglycine aminohydrolase